jgi:hypothetical protein
MSLVRQLAQKVAVARLVWPQFGQANGPAGGEVVVVVLSLTVV